jgi:hypothetical protein
VQEETGVSLFLPFPEAAASTKNSNSIAQRNKEKHWAPTVGLSCSLSGVFGGNLSDNNTNRNWDKREDRTEESIDVEENPVVASLR